LFLFSADHRVNKCRLKNLLREEQEMPINTITNNTGAAITLRDGGTVLAALAAGKSAHTLPITITGVSTATASYTRSSGSFVNNDSYSATINGNTMTFEGNDSTVKFSTPAEKRS
jgi:hypothetical protein